MSTRTPATLASLASQTATDLPRILKAVEKMSKKVDNPPSPVSPASVSPASASRKPVSKTDWHRLDQPETREDGISRGNEPSRRSL